MQGVNKTRMMEEQNGFSPGRGCSDGVYNIKTMLAKRQEHGLESFVAFIDFIKAFDKVSREFMWKCLAKYGIPQKLIVLIKKLYDGAVLSLKIDKDEVLIATSSGVKQGCGLSPLLFIVVIQAVLAAMKWPDECEQIRFKTHDDGLMHSRKIAAYDEKGSWFATRSSLFADDGAFPFETFDAMEKGISALVAHCAKGSLFIHYAHTGTPAGDSKSLYMHFPKPQIKIATLPPSPPLNIRPFQIEGKRYPAGQMGATPTFTYLGSIFNRKLTDDDDVENRIKKAKAAFAALAHVLTNRDLSTSTKRKLYVAVVITVLTYGAENWNGKDCHLRKLEVCHNSFVRRMLRINRWYQGKQKISTKTMNYLFGIRPIKYYILKRSLAWLGHVQRMDISRRLPKMLFYAWIPDAKRQVGRQAKHNSKQAQELLIDMAATLPAELSEIMSREKLPDVAAQSTTRGQKQRLKQHADLQKTMFHWKTTTKTVQAKWLTCSTWAQMAEDREIWKQATSLYLNIKFPT